jgi:hypothetical protein
VSPPWYWNCTGERFSPNIDARMPRGAYAPRSWLDVRSYIAKVAISPAHVRAAPRAAGVSPPWVGEPNPARRKSRTVRRRCDRRTRAAGVSPAWERNAPAMARVCSGRSTFAHHGWLTPAALGRSTCERDCKYAFRADEYAAFPTAGLRQPLLMHGVGRPKNYDIRAVQTHAFHERRASARRGSVNRTLPGENQARFGDDATH